MLDPNKEETAKPKEDETKQNLVTNNKKGDVGEATKEIKLEARDGIEAPMNGGGDKERQSEAKANEDSSSDKDVEIKDVEKKSEGIPVNGQAKSGDVAGAQPPPPVLKGTLSYNIELRRHLIRGMWNYENSSAFPHQRFELLRNLDATEDPKQLPQDGEFHGSFSLAYFHTTSKGKQKERSKVIPETGVKIKFTKIEGDEEGTYKVDGTGTNQFGIFHINGTANPSPHDDDQYNIVLRKRYEPPPTSAGLGGSEMDPYDQKSKKRKIGSLSGSSDSGDADKGPLPPPSKSYDKNVVCLRGKVYKEDSEELGLGEIVHRIHGMWSPGLDNILADPQNVNGLCNRFEYEHKSSTPSVSFPVSGKYSGWFDMNLDDGSKSKIVEKDVTLKFRKNNAGYHNVDGRGSNMFGKYTITGTLTRDNVITIFRHFKPIKLKGPNRPVTSAPPPLNAPGQTRRPSLPAAPEPQLKLDEVKVPEGDGPTEALKPPELPTYSAVSRGVLRINEDGSHTCQGKWAITREHFTNGQTSNFTFRLEAHFAKEAMEKIDDGRKFPLDSALYKGSFQLKKGGGSRYQTVIDQQIVMKFRKNTAGSYNVYGKGVNAIGIFNLTGTLIMNGKSGGQIEVYRMYPPELLNATRPAPKAAPKVKSASALPVSEVPPKSNSVSSSSSSVLPGPPRPGLSRRESTRLVKVPSRLEDDDPKAQLSRTLEKCNQILRFIREKDVERGAYFSEPVDPVALGIPTYHQVINQPMDLRTLHRKMELGEVSSPEEFGRLARLVFENAMTFNIDPTHSVHQAARNLLILFNQKYRDVERMLTTLRRIEKSDKKGKDDKKRRRVADEVKSLKRKRFDEAQEMISANTTAMNALLAATPSAANANVTRNEFNLMVQMIRDLQQQVVQTYTELANSTSDEIQTGAGSSAQELMAGIPVGGTSFDVFVPLSSTEKKKPTKKKPERKIEMPLEDLRPLTLTEQELLTDTINKLSVDQLPGVIQIIREAAALTGEEDEIDLEIDQLDTGTQRKLLRHVSKVRLVLVLKNIFCLLLL
jgi:hypothetical protein